MRKIIFYRTEPGNCPVEEFLDSLFGKQAQKVVWVLRLIEELNPIPDQYFKKLVNTEDIWEVRVGIGSSIFRLLGFFDIQMSLLDQIENQAEEVSLAVLDKYAQAVGKKLLVEVR